MTTTATIPTIIENTPPGTQAAMLEAAAAAKYPSHALPTIAGNFQITLADLQTILRRYGYPDTDRMRTAAAALRGEAIEQADQAITDNALTPTADQDTGKPRMVKVAVDDLVPDPDNLREHVVGVPSRDATATPPTPVDDIEQLADCVTCGNPLDHTKATDPQ